MTHIFINNRKICKSKYCHVFFLICIFRSNYLSDKIVEENKNDPKKLWKQLKDLGYKSKTEEAIIVLNINNELCHDSKTIADFFNNFISTIFYKSSWNFI
jgi:hypothetical protein